MCAAFIRVPGDVADPQPAAGFDDWAAWVKGGRTGPRPDVPEKVPADWWAKIGAELKGNHDPIAPHPAHPPAA